MSKTTKSTGSSANPQPRRVSRRRVLKGAAAATVAGLTYRSMGPFVRDAKAATLELRWFGWEHYNVKRLTAEFEDRHGVKVSAGFFDGNSEAWNRLRAGGTQDFDLVMAGGFWPRLYARQGLIQPVDYSRLDVSNVFADFMPPKFTVLRDEGGDNMIGAPNCWGGYSFTVNTDRVAAEDQESVNLLFNEKYGGHLSTGARIEENIALAGILAACNMGTIDGERPDGKGFNPYVLTDAELEECKRLLIKQKALLVNRWNDEDTLERLLRTQAVWASPESSGIYRRIHSDKLDGKSDLNMRHVLKPAEGGLGWVDQWSITSGVTDSEKMEIAHKWIDFRLERESMKTVAADTGRAPTVDVRYMLDARSVDTLFLNETGTIHGLYQFDAPSSPEKWQRIWTEVEAA